MAHDHKIMFYSTLFVVMLLLLRSSMLQVQKNNDPPTVIFRWNSSFTVCLYNVTLHPGESCTHTSVYDASRQNKQPQNGQNSILFLLQGPLMLHNCICV